MPDFLRGVRIERIPAWHIFGEYLLWPARLLRALRRSRPDVVWGNHPSPSADLAAVYARIARVPWVATYHADLTPERVYARVYTWWEGRLLRGARFVLVNADNYARRLVMRGVSREKIVVVTPGPGIGDGEPPIVGGPPDPSTPGPGPGRPLLFVGGLDRARDYKRPSMLLRAMAELRSGGDDVYLHVVGDGDRRSALERESRSLGLSDRVNFLGFRPDDELAEEYRDAWALVLPANSTEGFGLVALEAIQYGCPIVTSDAVASGVLLAKLGCGVTFADGDLGDLTRKLRWIWRSPEERAHLAVAASRVAPRFRWSVAAPELAGALRSAAAEFLGAHAQAPQRRQPKDGGPEESVGP